MINLRDQIVFVISRAPLTVMELMVKINLLLGSKNCLLAEQFHIFELLHLCLSVLRLPCELTCRQLSFLSAGFKKFNLILTE